MERLLIKNKKFGKTWFIDLDGTIFEHNGYLVGENILLKNAKLFLDSIPKDDCIIFVTARTNKYEKMTLTSLNNYKIKYDGIIFNITSGTRILINDKKINNKRTCFAYNKRRNTSNYPFYILKSFKFKSLKLFFRNLIFSYKFY